MTDQPPTAAEALARAQLLLDRAIRELGIGIAAHPDEDNTARLWRVHTFSAAATAAAHVAQAHVLVDLLHTDPGEPSPDVLDALAGREPPGG